MSYVLLSDEDLTVWDTFVVFFYFWALLFENVLMQHSGPGLFECMVFYKPMPAGHSNMT